MLLRPLESVFIAKNRSKHRNIPQKIKSSTAGCTKTRQGLVNQLHSIDFTGDKSALF